MNVQAIRAALAADLTFDGLECSAYRPVTIVPPTAWVGAPVIQFDDTFDDHHTLTFPVVVLTSNADTESGQDDLDELYPLIRAAVDNNLNGACQSAHVLRAEGYGDDYDVGGLAYVGATFIVEVYA